MNLTACMCLVLKVKVISGSKRGADLALRSGNSDLLSSFPYAFQVFQESVRRVQAASEAPSVCFDWTGYSFCAL